MSQLGDETAREAAARGRKEGRETALLEQHSSHLAAINGSIDASKRALDDLKDAIHRLSVNNQDALRDLEDKLTEALAGVESGVRTLNEDARLNAETLKTAADTLARETERRREELALTAEAADRGTSRSDTLFSRRQAIIVAAVGIVVTVASLLLGRPWG